MHKRGTAKSRIFLDNHPHFTDHGELIRPPLSAEGRTENNALYINSNITVFKTERKLSITGSDQ
jgi:hypothetical protein